MYLIEQDFNDLVEGITAIFNNSSKLSKKTNVINKLSNSNNDEGTI